MPRRTRPVTLNIRISEQEMADMKRTAIALDRTVSYVAGMAIRRFLYGDEEGMNLLSIKDKEQ